MNKKLISAITAVFVAGSSFMVTFAETKQISGYEIKSEGKIPDISKSTAVSIDIYAPGKKYTDLLAASPADYKNIVVYRNEMKSGNDGGYSFDITVPEISSGWYTAYISPAGKEEVTKEEFLYSNPNSNKTVLGKLNAAALTGAAAVAGVFDERVDDLGNLDLGFSEKYFSAQGEALNKSKVLALLADAVKKNQLDVNDMQGGVSVYELCVEVERLNEGKRESIADVFDVIKVEESSINGWYSKKYVTGAVLRNMTQRLSGKNFDEVSDLYDSLAAAYILAVVEETDGYGNVKEVLNGFASEIGITQNAKDAVYETLTGTDFESLSALKTRFDGLKGGSQGGGGASGGGGGGSASAKPNQNIDMGYGFGGEFIPETPEKLDENVFNDLDSVEWAKEAIVALTEAGVLNGKGNYMFYPNDKVTREEFAKMIVSALEIGLSGSCDFSDVDKNAWYYPYVAAAFSGEIVEGVGSGKFGTGANITRQDLAVMAYRAAKSQNIVFGEYDKNDTFADDGTIADYAKEAVYTLKGDEVINGKEGRTFAPKAYATRAEAAKIIYLLTRMK